MTTPALAVCPVCHGDGVQPVLVDAELAERVGIASLLATVVWSGPVPCLLCRCFCGQLAAEPGGLCLTHEDESWLEEDARARRRADV